MSRLDECPHCWHEHPRTGRVTCCHCDLAIAPGVESLAQYVASDGYHRAPHEDGLYGCICTPIGVLW